ncbi:MAG: hypothetical protein CMH52_13870 [Myxococcales bacterium]|nr:hypothetical protein [Myxococcales bacterium]
MRIAYVYDGYYPSTGADAWQVLNTATALSRQGAHVTLVFPQEPGGVELTKDELLAHYDIQGDIDVIQLKSSNVGGRHLKKLVHSYTAMTLPAVCDADVVYSRNLPVIMAALKAGHKVVYDTYRPWPAQYRAMRLLFKRLFASDRLLGGFFHSQHALNAYRDAGIASEKLCVAHNGFHPKLFRVDQSAPEARLEIGMPEQTFTLGYTGRLDIEKGLLTLLELAEVLPSINLLLVGGGNDEAVLEKARNLSNVYLYDWQKPSAVPTFLRACDILMIPPSGTALKAGNTVLPMKLFDYFASGRVIVAPESPDTAELLKHDENAWLVKDVSIDELARQIEALRSDEDRLTQLTQGALDQSEQLTWDSRGLKLINQIEAWTH